jgi:hypothetical protein
MSLWRRLRAVLLHWWRAEVLLSRPLTAEVVILFDADMAWIVHENKVDLTPLQVQIFCAGLFEATQAIAAKHGVQMTIALETPPTP